MPPITLRVFACLAILFSIVNLASADTIIRFNLAGPGTDIVPDFLFGGTELELMDDGNASTAGSQNTNINFSGFLDPLFVDIGPIASMSFSGASFSGPATVVGTTVFQATNGGTFSFFDASNQLLLVGDLTNGLFSGDTSADTGSFSSIAPVSYTGGSLLSYLDPQSGAISLSFTEITTGGQPGLLVINDQISPFVADATGQVVAASAVPEPVHLALLAVGSTLALVRHRRRQLS